MSRDLRYSLLLGAVVLVLFADVLLLGRGFFRGDLFAYHFPMKKVVRDMTFAEGVPQWNPRYHGGQPLAANPAYELWYPPQWLVYAPSFEWGFQLHILIHIVIAAMGMYAFLRSLELRALAAAFGALSFALGAPYLSLLLRLPFLFSMAWMPFVLLFARRLMLRPNRRDFAWTALFVGMQALIGEPVMLLQTGMLAASYLLYRWRQHAKQQKPAKKKEPVTAPRVSVLHAGWLSGAMFAGLLLAAVQLVPGFDHARDSVRSEGFTWQIVSNWSTPPVRLAEVAWPQLYRALVGTDGHQAVRNMYPYRIEPFVSDIYPGLLVVVLAAAGIFAGVRGRGYVSLLLLGFTLLALGEHTPLFRWLFDLKLFASIRYPEKFLLGALFVMIVWAAVVLDRFLDGDAKVRKSALWLAAVWIGLSLITWAAGTRVPNPSTPDSVPLAWTQYWLLNLGRGIAVLFLVWRNRFPLLLLLFPILDAAFVHTTAAARAPRSFFDEPAIAQQLPPDRASYRLFHEASWEDWAGSAEAVAFYTGASADHKSRDAMMQFRPAAFGFHGALEDDLDQTALLSTTRFLRSALNVYRTTQSWNSFFLDAANVEQVIDFEGATPVVRANGSHPRYRFATRLLPATDEAHVVQAVLTGNAREGDAYTPAPFASAGGRVLSVNEQPSRITLNVEAAGDALLVASVTSHRYWRATIDGHDAPLVAVNIAFQGVRVPPGAHVVELRYRNPLLPVAGAVSVAALLALLAAALWRRAER
ncbi:MAG TPA: YfhO family protein [Thermoanaerobaculia bacterium]